jgi:beta-N-acetylhexosaminidase
VARELAERSITLVRNDDALLPLHPAADARLCVIEPAPMNLTPADTSAHVAPTLAAAIRRRWPATDAIDLSADPSSDEIRAVLERLASYALVILGTSAAHLRPSHASLANAVLAAGRPTVTVALRTPWDLSAYPRARTHLCTYSRLAPSMDALAAILFGELAPEGRLPVVLGDLHSRGHGLTQWR